jgi:hypothetical protein
LFKNIEVDLLHRILRQIHLIISGTQLNTEGLRSARSGLQVSQRGCSLIS